jgi:cyclophilin family peptidyl-prolyl cis-trans isomerase
VDRRRYRGRAVPTTSKKQRQQQRRKGSAQARQAAARARRRTSRQRWAVIATFLILVLVLGLAQVIDVGGKGRPAPVQLFAPPQGETITGDTPCPDPNGSSPRTTTFEKPPPMCIDPAKSYAAAIETSKGLITLDLDVKNAPKTVNNFVVLSRYHFYDGLPFHRIAVGQFIQGGSPTADSSGGPGYQFEDELPVTPYKIGTMAMANAGPDTNGSQFFFVIGQNGVDVLAPKYSILGQVTQGMSVLASIEKKGSVETGLDPDGGKPTEVITIESVTIKET